MSAQQVVPVELSEALQEDPELSEHLQRMAQHLDPVTWRRWTAATAELAARASPAATAAFAAASCRLLAPGGILEPGELEGWASTGLSLCRGNRKSSALAARYFAVSDAVIPTLGLEGLERLATITARVAEGSPEAAVTFLGEAARLFGGDGFADEGFLDLLDAITRRSWFDGLQLVETMPGPLADLPHEQRERLSELTAAASAAMGAGEVGLLLEAASTLVPLSPEDQARLVDVAESIAAVSPQAALEWLGSADEVVERVGLEPALRWAEMAIEPVGVSTEPASVLAWVRRESVVALDALAELSPRVELERVQELLALYLEALSGEPVGFQPGGTARHGGLRVSLPAWVETFQERRENFDYLKLSATHQILRHSLRGCAPASHRLLGRLPDADDAVLAADLLALAEAVWTDGRIQERYRGLLPTLRRVQLHEAERRPAISGAGLRQVFVENLVRLSLDQPGSVRWPSQLSRELSSARRILDALRRAGDEPAGEVESAAAALYQIAHQIPNIELGAISGRWRAAGKATPRRPPEGPELQARLAPLLGEEATEIEYASPPRPGFHLLAEGASATEAVDDTAPTRDLGALDPAALLDLADVLDDSEAPEAEADDSPVVDGPDLVVEDEDAAVPGDEEQEDDDGSDAALAETGAEVAWFSYDEWDFRSRDHRPRWCTVGERASRAGDESFYRAVLQERHGLVSAVRRQFERLRPESFRWIRQLEDGHEIDLDRAVMFHADKLAGVGPQARFYARRDISRRDVAVALLLDVSASTNDEIDAEARPGARRVIDVEKEAAVLFSEALEAIGDAYSIYAFSGYGRRNVELWRVKELDDELDDEVRGRIGALSPGRSTRMGAAIRHVTSKLAGREAKVRLLVLVSDGRPQDIAYGAHPGDRDYAVHDTKEALMEARSQGITPFLVTVDREGNEYLGEMCGDLGYAVVADVTSLPERLPALYRTLTTS